MDTETPAARQRKKRGPKNHAIHRVPGAGGWSCSCGRTGEADLSALQHHQTVSAAAVKRLTSMELRALIITSADNGVETDAVHLIFGLTGPRWDPDDLRPYLITDYGGYGNLRASLDWRTLNAAAASGELARHTQRESDDIELIRFGCSLLGFGDVNLRFLRRCVDDRGMRLVNAALRHLFPDNPE